MPTKSNNIGGRGGKRSGAGRKKKTLIEKLEDNKVKNRKIEILDIPDIEGEEMPKPDDILSQEQRDRSEFRAKKIYEKVWRWLKSIGCNNMVSTELIEKYSMASTRWIQCEEMTNKLGFLSKHPTTGKPIPSPFINIGINYMNQSMKLWNEIFQIVREKCTTEFIGNLEENDLMEQLLRSKEKKMFEKVNPKHPDKIADCIAGAIVDLAY